MRFIVVAAACAALIGCKSSSPTQTESPELDAGSCTSPAFAGAPFGVQCNALVDAQGRTVFLHGVNARIDGVFDTSFANGHPPLETDPPFSADDAHAMRAAGFNALRLAFNWSGAEPTETGGFDEAYIDRIAAVVDACRSAGIYVLLDSHQDGFSKETGEDGAPLWAIVPAPTQTHDGPTADADVLSKEAAAAFETFFGGTADGARLRDRYAKMLAHVATRFASDDAVVGLEIINEPLASDADLANAYGPMIAAIREAAPKKLVFFEPAGTRNEIDRASLGSGSAGAGTVYAPHVYTFVFTGNDATRASITKDSLARSNQSAREEADSWAAPLVITEFGYGPSSPNFADYVRWQMELQDEAQASSFFWVWKEEPPGTWGFYDYNGQVPTPRAAVFTAMQHVRAESLAGRVVSVGYDSTAHRFEAQFIGDGKVASDNVIAIGGALANYDATCDGVPLAHDASDPVTLPCGGGGAHVLVLTGR